MSGADDPAVTGYLADLEEWLRSDAAPPTEEVLPIVWGSTEPVFAATDDR